MSRLRRTSRRSIHRDYPPELVWAARIRSLRLVLVAWHSSSAGHRDRARSVEVWQIVPQRAREAPRGSSAAIAPTIGARLPLARIADAHRLVETGAVVGKVVIDCP